MSTPFAWLFNQKVYTFWSIFWAKGGVLQGERSFNVSGAARPRWQEKWLPPRGITTARTELMWLIDHKPTNQKETQYAYLHIIGDIGVSPCGSNKISFCWVWSVWGSLWRILKCSLWLFCYLKSFPHEVQVVVTRKLCLLMNWFDMCI